MQILDQYVFRNLDVTIQTDHQSLVTMSSKGISKPAVHSFIMTTLYILDNLPSMS